MRVDETGGRLGFITPTDAQFLRILQPGADHLHRARCTPASARKTPSDLRRPLRASPDDDLLNAAIDRAIGTKPKGHDFIIDRHHNRPSVGRHMSVTGG